MILTAHYHHPLGTMLKLGDSSGACYCHTCAWGNREHPAELRVLLKIHHLHCVREPGDTPLKVGTV